MTLETCLNLNHCDFCLTALPTSTTTPLFTSSASNETASSATTSDDDNDVHATPDTRAMTSVTPTDAVRVDAAVSTNGEVPEPRTDVQSSDPQSNDTGLCTQSLVNLRILTSLYNSLISLSHALIRILHT